jgi:hypothetical protein
MEAYPLHWPVGWPRTRQPLRSQFKHTGHVTTLALFAEIKRLGGRLPVLSTNVRLRQDGLPYANDKAPDDKGVAVYFQYKGNSMAFACDKWDKVADNIQSIRKTIEALRGIERWGASDMMERAFQGFQALPAPGAETPWDVLGVPPKSSPDVCREARNRLARRFHPDNGSEANADMMAKVNRAFTEAAGSIAS